MGVGRYRKPGNAGKIKRAVVRRFGPGARPQAIILTHGHFDHAGNAKELAELWDVKVYAHRLERPFLTGKSDYPPMDPTAPGFFAAISRFLPTGSADLRDRLNDLNGALPELGFSDWEIIETPGHTPGHVSFFRRSDGGLLAGDAFATVNMDNLFTLAVKKREVYRPAVPATTNWQQARESVQKLAHLRPSVIGAGYGAPMTGAARELEQLAANFPVPSHGRYTKEPARFDDAGITYLPPAPPDNGPKIAAAVAVGLVSSGLAIAILRRKK